MEEKKELSKKEKRTLMIVSLAIVIALVFGVSYAYFMAVGQSDEQTITTANLSLTFDDGTAIVNATDISPLVREVALPTQDTTGKVTTAGEAVTKTFTITNTGNQKLFVDISLDDMTLPDDLKRYDFLWSLYEVTDTTNNIEKNIGTGSFEYAENGMKVGQYLVFDAPGDGVTTHERTFRLYIWIEETYIEQEVMMGETFKATITATGQKYYTTPEEYFTVSDDGVLTAYTGTDTDIVIPPVVGGTTVTAIGDKAFYENTTIENVVIPDTVTSIGTQAFEYSSVKNIIIPNSVTSIGNIALSEASMENIIIPNSVTTIGENAFSYNSLRNTIIPNTITIINTGAFQYTDFKNIIIPNSVITIEEYAFQGSKLKNVIIGNSVTTIEMSAFNSCSLTNVIIGDSVTSIGEDAFSGNQLTSITIPSNVKSIESWAFLDNPLTEIIVEGKDSLDDFTDSSGLTDFADIITFKP